MTKRIQWIISLLTLLVGGVFVYAQNPVSIAQVGTTAVSTTLPVSGTVTASQGTAANLNATVVGTGTFTTQSQQSGTWTVQPGNTANTTAWKVDGSAVTQPVSGTLGATQSGTWTVQPGNTANTTAWKVDGSAVTQPVSGTVTANMGTVTADPFGANADAASATGSISAKLRFIAGTGIPVTGTVTVGSHAVTNAGTFAVQPTANAQIDNNKWNGQALASPDANSYVLVSAAATATTTAGTSTCYFPSAASNNAQFCKASAGNLYEIHVSNTTTTNYFLRLYNLAAAPTCSSATGFVETVPAFGAAANGGVNGRLMNPPQAFTTGIAFCLTGGSSSTDNTNAATGVTITLLYK